MAQQVSTNTFGTAKWIVSSDATQGTHTTIAGALTSASSGDTIFIRPGTYTENLTLKVGVNLVAYEADAYTPNVIIVGKATLTTAGTTSISGIQLKTNSDFFLAVTGTVASIVNLNNCNLNCNNNTGISFTTSSASAQINITNCSGTVGTTGIAFIAQSSAGTTVISGSMITNPGATTTASTVSAGALNMYNTTFNLPITYSSASTANIFYTVFGTSSTNTIAITTSGTAAINLLHSTIASGSAAALSIGSGSSISGVNVVVTSTNTNPVTGAGTYANGGTTFTGTGSGINTTTKTAFITKVGELLMPLQPAFSAYQSSAQTNITGDGTTATLSFTTEIFDQANNFDGTSTFTAPVTGRYFLQFSVVALGLLITHTSGSMAIVTTARSYLGNFKNWFTSANSTAYGADMSVFADMTAGDTATCTLQISGGTKVVGSQAGDPRTRFSGYLVC